MTTEPSHDSAPARPNKREAASSPTAVSNLIASAMLLAGLFLPHSVGCDDRPHRAISMATTFFTESREFSDFLALTILWPFAFALLTVVVIATLVIVRPKWYDRALIAIPITTAIALVLIWILLLFSGPSLSRMALTFAVVVIPSGACVAARMMWLCRSNRVTSAASWGQGLICVLAAFSLRWFWFPPVSRLLWGGVFCIVSTMLMLLASWCWITRARYDLYDRSSKPQPFQVSIRQIILGIAITAIALTYWRVLGTQ